MRHMYLGDNIDVEHMHATFNNGILTLNAQKQLQANELAKRIRVN
ncbi:Hsp20/alpha crystallin family protein [Catenovulum sp. SM1970]|nr:Hsp20/alpha crystallin family protein [Marinifaba aquimaris]NTS77269.1 Hsp20/alpha crystallin family protein [Marinifaba aquimaris]